MTQLQEQVEMLRCSHDVLSLQAENTHVTSTGLEQQRKHTQTTSGSQPAPVMTNKRRFEPAPFISTASITGSEQQRKHNQTMFGSKSGPVMTNKR